MEDMPDIVFNIAEGIHGRGREAQVPALLDFYKIPYTGSDETTLCIALDKAMTKYEPERAAGTCVKRHKSIQTGHVS